MQLQLDGAGSLDGKQQLEVLDQYFSHRVHQRLLAEILDRLEQYVAEHPEVHDDPDFWVQGMGWDQTRWANWSGEFPTSVS
jgi:hypothetical protein